MKLFNNWFLTGDYILGFILATSIIIFFIPYFRNRIKEGVINLLSIAGLMFFLSYDFKMITGIWIRITGLVYDIDPNFREFQTTIWGIAQFMVVVSLSLITYLVFTKKYDVWFYLKKIEPDKSKVVETAVDDYMKDQNINSETIHELGKEEERYDK